MAKLTGWLKRFRDTLAEGIAAIAAMDGQMVEIDIKRRKRDRAIAKRYADNRLKLMEELDKIGMSEAEFCGKLGNGNSLDRMRRRMRLVPQANWDRYVRLRRERTDAVFTLATLTRNTIVTAIAPALPLIVLARPTPVQRRAYELLQLAL